MWEKKWPKKGETDPGAVSEREKDTERGREKDYHSAESDKEWPKENEIKRAEKRRSTVRDCIHKICNILGGDESHYYVSSKPQERTRSIITEDWQFINSPAHTHAHSFSWTPLCSRIDLWKMKPCNFLYYSQLFESKMRTFIPHQSETITAQHCRLGNFKHRRWCQHFPVLLTTSFPLKPGSCGSRCRKL